jgi:hypothetical protein
MFLNLFDAEIAQAFNLQREDIIDAQEMTGILEIESLTSS